MPHKTNIYIAPQIPINFSVKQTNELNSFLFQTIKNLPYHEINAFEYIEQLELLKVGWANITSKKKTTNKKIIDMKNDKDITQLFFLPSKTLAYYLSQLTYDKYNFKLDEIRSIEPQLLEAKIIHFKTHQQTSSPNE
jgi:helix-turn-helix protein